MNFEVLYSAPSQNIIRAKARKQLYFNYIIYIFKRRIDLTLSRYCTSCVQNRTQTFVLLQDYDGFGTAEKRSVYSNNLKFVWKLI